MIAAASSFRPGLFGLAVTATLASAGCAEDGVSTDELRTAAEQRVREALQLKPGANLASSAYVGRPGEDIVLCGSVAGERADGTAISPRRFVAATDPARWVRFERPGELGFSGYDFEQVWAHHCVAAQEA